MKYYQVHDRFFHQAKRQGLRARSVFKLKYLDRKFKLFHPQSRVLDLGAYPGSWTEYTAERAKEVIATDLKQMKPFPQKNIQIQLGDIFQMKFGGEFDIILSDMAPHISGIANKDQQEIRKLNEQVLKIAQKHLKPKGRVVCKTFLGNEFDDFLKKLKQTASEVKVVLVPATRPTSKERYLVYKLKTKSSHE